MEKRKKVTFKESTHQYFLDDTELPSVSKLVKSTHEAFDAKATASRMALQGKGTVKGLLDQWKATAKISTDKGNLIHNLAEEIINVYKEQPSTSMLIGALAMVLQTKPEIIAAEKLVYSTEYLYAGTADLLIYDDEEVIMYDYKTNKDLYKNFRGKRMLSPFDDMLDCPANKYFVQQNLYAIALEEEGIHVDKMYLLWIREDETERVAVPDLKEKIKLWLKSKII